MTKKIFKFAFLSSLFFLASCFEVVEEINLNDDGSGNIEFTINLSRSKTKLNSIMLLDSINNYKVPKKQDIKNHFTKTVNEIKKINGVSNVKQTTNFEDFIFTINCDFNNIDVLNKVISHFGSTTESKRIMKNKHFKYNTVTKTFTRNYHYDLQSEFNKINSKDKEIFKNASYTTIYRFESLINTSKNKSAKISGSKKAIMLKVPTQDIISNKNTIKNTIQLK